MPIINKTKVLTVTIKEKIDGKIQGKIFALECKCTNPTGTEYLRGEWYRDKMQNKIPNIGVDDTGYMACCKKCGCAPWIISPGPIRY